MSVHMFKFLELLGLGKKRTPWQELVGVRPHMIEESAMDGGFGGMPEPEDDDEPSYDIENRIAHIDIAGVLINDEDWWDGWGCSTYGRIQREVAHAAANPAVDGILLCVNSPGGETDLAFETADKIVAARKQKPVWCVAETSAYSAGYLLASCGSRLYVPQYSGGVGSIGVYSLHMDYSGMLENAGVKPTFMEAGKGKTDGHPYKPLSPAAKQRIQANVDRLYGLFVDHVAAQRGIPGGSIRELGAALFTGAEAIASSLADRIGDEETAMLEMREWLNSRETAPVPVTQPAAAAAQEVSMPENNAAVTQQQQEPVADDPVVAEREAAANRDRIFAICAVAGLTAKQAQDHIAAGRTPDQVSAEIETQRAAASAETEIVSQLQPHTSASVEPTNINESPIVRAAEKLAKQGR